MQVHSEGQSDGNREALGCKDQINALLESVERFIATYQTLREAMWFVFRMVNSKTCTVRMEFVVLDWKWEDFMPKGK